MPMTTPLAALAVARLCQPPQDPEKHARVPDTLSHAIWQRLFPTYRNARLMVKAASIPGQSPQNSTSAQHHPLGTAHIHKVSTTP